MNDDIPRRVGDIPYAITLLERALDAPAEHHKAEKVRQAYTAIEEWADRNDVQLK